MRGFLAKFGRKRIYASVENVVASATFDHKINLDSIAKAFSHVAYKPKRFPGLVFKLNDPKTSLLIFASGKMVCAGAKSEESARKAILKVVDELRKRGIEVDSRPEIEIQNIVASGNLGGPVELEKAAFALKRTLYEPEQFPGMIYRMEEPRVVMLIFTNGKVVCTGAKQESQVDEAISGLRRILKENDLISIDQSKD